MDEDDKHPPEDVEEVADDSLVDEATQRRYRVWKKNAPYLYDYLVTTNMPWPSRTVEFFPDLVKKDEFTEQRVLYGTYTCGTGLDYLGIGQITTPVFNVSEANLDYNPDKQEFAVKNFRAPRFKPLQKITHYGDVCKAAYMPQNANVLASANNHGQVAVYERTKLSSRDTAEVVTPHIRLEPTPAAGVEISALAWNPHREGQLVTGDEEGNLYAYDITQFREAGATLPQTQGRCLPESRGLNDAKWCPHHPDVVVLAGENGEVSLFDLRSNAVGVSHAYSSTGINSVAPNPGLPECIAAGDAQGAVVVADTRQWAANEHMALPGHSDAVTQLRWHPQHANVIASSSQDRSVRLYNVADRADPVMFVHEGHMFDVNDFDWSRHDEWMVASVAHDNTLQVWRPAGMPTF
ncbi:histone-binding protein Msi1p [Diutina catenulata]